MDVDNRGNIQSFETFKSALIYSAPKSLQAIILKTVEERVVSKSGLVSFLTRV